jgi:hypothetical protein
MNEQLIGDLFAEATRRMTGSSSREFSQKFAELIVRECANIDFRREVGLTADDDYEIGKVIKVHFGVEE